MKHIRTSMRRELIDKRDALSSEFLAGAAKAIVNSVIGAVPVKPGTVAAYVAYGGELDVSPAALALAERGWRLVLPVCGPNASLEFCPWAPGDPLTKNRLGIDEPTSAPVPLNEVDVVLVPGVGFDACGSRIGHGMGFYDRYFARCFEIGHDPRRIGIAHDLQVVELPEPERWDVAMHLILTPTKVLDIASCA
jgi:5-formyltetrahydrofolate cyclo-ligase